MNIIKEIENTSYEIIEATGIKLKELLMKLDYLEQLLYNED